MTLDTKKARTNEGPGLTRRSFLVAVPAVVAYANLMPVRGIIMPRDGVALFNIPHPERYVVTGWDAFGRAVTVGVTVQRGVNSTEIFGWENGLRVFRSTEPNTSCPSAESKVVEHAAQYIGSKYGDAGKYDTYITSFGKRHLITKERQDKQVHESGQDVPNDNIGQTLSRRKTFTLASFLVAAYAVSPPGEDAFPLFDPARDLQNG